VGGLRLPVFPLPDVVFFPETVLPLHVFEPRYRRMVADCLAGNRWLVVARLRAGWEKDYEGRPPIHEIAGAGEILQAESLPEGRFNILVEGRCRVNIESEEPPGEVPYRIARVARLPDRLPGAAGPAFAEQLKGLRLAHTKLLAALGQTHADVVARLTVAGVGPGAIIDRIVSAVVPDASVRQRILETPDVAKRLDLATAAVSDVLAFVAGPAGEDDPEEE
jgi:hypothetical protein